MIGSAAAIAHVQRGPAPPLAKVRIVAEVVHSAARYVQSIDSGGEDAAAYFQQLVDAVTDWRDIAPESYAMAVST